MSTARCRYAENRADDLFDQFLDLMDALDSQDVIRVLEQHTPRQSAVSSGLAGRADREHMAHVSGRELTR
jgi:hypothetical protein